MGYKNLMSGARLLGREPLLQRAHGLVPGVHLRHHLPRRQRRRRVVASLAAAPVAVIAAALCRSTSS